MKTLSIWLALTMGGVVSAAEYAVHPPNPVGTNAPAITWTTVNETLGLPLLSSDNLWAEQAGETATRLKWVLESHTSLEDSYRGRAGCRVLGAQARSLALYSRNGLNASLSLIFANKGDLLPLDSSQTREAHVMDYRHAADYQKAIPEDAQTIRRHLTELLGAPVREVVGQGGAQTRERVERWDWRGHAFLLSAPHDEYVRLQIMPSSMADNHGVPPRIGAAELKKLLSQRIQKRPNGDVILTDIPMVSQGAKGYCVPATWERYLRYLGIPADMYVLGLAGNTQAGGGTYSDFISATVNPLLQKNRRYIQTFNTPLDANTVATHINKGLPIMWCMFSLPELDASLNRRMAERNPDGPQEEWKKKVKIFTASARQLRPDPSYAHMCMIIGYNRVTGEIAISDSWGPRYAERWITTAEARAVSQNLCYVISW